MATVHKYELTDGVSAVRMPAGSMVLSVGNQGGTIQVWALVDPKAPEITRVFRVIGTGHEYADVPGEFVGTVLLAGGGLVLHIFDHGES